MQSNFLKKIKKLDVNILENENEIYALNLHENEPDNLKPIDQKIFHKSKVNTDFERKIKIKVDYFQENINMDKNNKKQIIIISRKRKRDVPDEKFLQQENFKIINNFERKHLVRDEYSNSNSIKKFKFDSVKENENKQFTSEREDLLEKMLSLEISNSSFRIKDRSSRIFSNNETCTICKIKKGNEKYLKNFYPIDITIDFLDNMKEEEDRESSESFKACRQLKFVEKRKIINSHHFLDAKKFQNIKKNFTQLYGEFQIINTHDRLIIVNEKRLTRDEILTTCNKLIPDEEFTYQMIDIDNDKCKNETDILYQIQRYQNGLQIETNIENQQYVDDQDSNSENNPNNDYPDEESDEEDEYEIYDTNRNARAYLKFNKYCNNEEIEDDLEDVDEYNEFYL